MNMATAAGLGVSAFAARWLLRRNAQRGEWFDSDDEDAALPSLPVLPTLLLAAGVSLVTWINAVEKEDVSKTREDMESASDLMVGRRSIAICTSASVPWLTGTAVNPAIRAVELAKRGHNVVLMVPWLIPEDQHFIFSGKTLFTSPEEQAAYVAKWLEGLVPEKERGTFTLPTVKFYFGGYAKDVGCVFPLSDIVASLDPHFDRDVLLLEEPEHLTWYYYGQGLSTQFRFVVGVVHTNYVAYAMHWDFPVGIFKSGLLWFYNKWCSRAHTHRVIKLSDAMQGYPRQITTNVHGVRKSFLRVGASSDAASLKKGAYFVGKLVWQKGYNRLVPLLKYYYRTTGVGVTMEWFGHGDDTEEIMSTVQQEPALQNIECHGVTVDHIELTDYKVLVNASESEGLATVTMEAIAMRKNIVVPDHPSNRFFQRFRNAYFYRNRREFVSQLDKALATDPSPLSRDEENAISWSAATDRFIKSCQISEPRGPVDHFLANFLERIMVGVSSKVFEYPEYKVVMREIRARRRSRRPKTTEGLLVLG